MFICLFLQLDEIPLKVRNCLLCVTVISTVLGTLQMLNKGLWKKRIQFQFHLGSCCTECLLEVILAYNSLVEYDENCTVHNVDQL